jgi:hypothetical protein
VTDTGDGEQTIDREPTVGVTRRGGIASSLKLAVSAPAALAALGVRTAFADHDDRDDHDDDHHHDHDHDGHEQKNHQNAPLKRTGSFVAALSRLTDVASADFVGTSAPSDLNTLDPLTGGRVAVTRGNGDGSSTVSVDLTGAAKSVQYLVQFVHLRDQGRENLGGTSASNLSSTITTDANGRCRGHAGALPQSGGKNRVGVFVLSRNGVDQYVTALYA